MKQFMTVLGPYVYLHSATCVYSVFMGVQCLPVYILCKNIESNYKAAEALVRGFCGRSSFRFTCNLLCTRVPEIPSLNIKSEINSIKGENLLVFTHKKIKTSQRHPGY